MIPEPGFQKPMPNFEHTAAESYTSALTVARRAEIDLRSRAGPDEVITMDGRRYDDLVEPGRHELQRHDLSQGVLECDSVGVEVHVAPPPLRLLPDGRRADG